MIKPEELRIGNWVTWPEEKQPNEVEWSHGHWLGVFEKNYPFPEGIPLTEEWLIKFGFKKIEESPFTEDIELKYWVNNRVCLFFNDTIQNIYFSLTGEELTNLRTH